MQQQTSAVSVLLLLLVSLRCTYIWCFSQQQLQQQQHRLLLTAALQHQTMPRVRRASVLPAAAPPAAAGQASGGAAAAATAAAENGVVEAAAAGGRKLLRRHATCKSWRRNKPEVIEKWMVRLLLLLLLPTCDKAEAAAADGRRCCVHMQRAAAACVRCLQRAQGLPFVALDKVAPAAWGFLDFEGPEQLEAFEKATEHLPFRGNLIYLHELNPRRQQEQQQGEQQRQQGEQQQQQGEQQQQQEEQQQQPQQQQKQRQREDEGEHRGTEARRPKKRPRMHKDSAAAGDTSAAAAAAAAGTEAAKEGTVERDFAQQRPQLPALLQLINNKPHLTDAASIEHRVAPLHCLSYYDQLKMKHTYLKARRSAATCIRQLTKAAHQSYLRLLPAEERNPRACQQQQQQGDDGDGQNNSSSSSRSSGSSNNQQQSLPWHSPKVAKRWVGCEVLPALPAPVKGRVGYRNKCEFTIGLARRPPQQQQQDGEQQLEDGEEQQQVPCVGFVCGVQRLQPQVASPSGLLLLNHGMQEAAHAMEELIKSSKFPIYDRRSHEGTWRLLMVRTSAANKSMMLVVQINPFKQQQQQQQQQQAEAGGARAELIRSVVSAFGSRVFGGYKVTSIFIQENAAVSDSVEGHPVEKIFGEDELEHQLCGLRCRLGPVSFFQTNTPACEVMYKAVLQLLLPLSPSEPLLDICSGAGTIALCAAAALKQLRAAANSSSSSSSSSRVIGIEMVESAVEDAVKNAKLNGLQDDVRFIAGKAEDVLPSLLEEFSGEASISAVVDPPRMGLHPKVVKALKHCKQLGKLVYVSCNCKTLVENVLELVSEDCCSDPFVPIVALPVDMFPHTLHCEAVLLLARRSKAAAAAAEFSSKRQQLLDLTAVEGTTAAAAAGVASSGDKGDTPASHEKQSCTAPSSSSSSSSNGSSKSSNESGVSPVAAAASSEWQGANPLLD
ncbi:hypothetical protein Efla_001783 [Eimeria flavescens]